MKDLLSPTTKVNTGQRFGLAVVVGLPFWVHIKEKHRISHVVARCDCGKPFVCAVASLVRAKRPLQSCGPCGLRNNLDHGESHTRLFKIYNGIRQRCFNENRLVYKDYGGRGIVLCDEWNNDFLKFKAWSLENGYADSLSIDRIDNDKGYYPENCRWTTIDTQANNRRGNVIIEAMGEQKTIAEWSRDSRCPVSYQALQWRLSRGWDADRAVTAARRSACHQGTVKRR